MKLKIKEDIISPAIATGIDDKNVEYKVIGGDLCYGEIVEVNPSPKSPKIFILSEVNYESMEIFNSHFDKDGLIEFNKLKEVRKKSRPFKRIYELDGFWVFPENRIKDHVEYLYENGLIQSSRIRISKSWSSVESHVSVYSIDYLKLLKKVIDEKEAKSAWFYCEREKDFDKGVYADLFILSNFNEADLQIQLWQIIGDGSEALFVHGIIDRDSFKFKHFDLATH